MTGAPTEASRAAQALSPRAEAAASPYIRLQPGGSGTLDVAFTYTHMPPGQFTFAGPAAHSPNAVLHLNVRENDYYQNGIPGVTDSVAGTAEWIGAVARSLGATRLRMIGASMGAYAALLFGHLAGADVIYAMSPVLRPGNLALGARTRFRDIAPLLPGLAPRTVATFGAFELGEYQFALPCLEAGFTMDDLHFFADFHPGLQSLRLADLFAWAQALPAAALLIRPHPSGLDAADVAQLSRVMDRVAAGDHGGAASVLGPVTRRDERNAGLLYRLGVHQALAGWTDAAQLSLRRAQAMLNEIGAEAIGADADLRRRSVQDYAHLLGFAPLQAVHALLDGTDEA